MDENNDFTMSNYPKYQYSIFLSGREEQLVIRADTWEEFLTLKKNADAIITKKQKKQALEGTTEAQGASETKHCPKCGGEMWDNRKNKPSPKYPDYKCKECGNAIWL